MKKTGNGKEAVLSFFFPRRCPICDEVVLYGRDICPECEQKLSYIREPSCKKCGKALENERQEYCNDCGRKKHSFRQGKAVFSYQNEIKLSMYRFKYSGRCEYAAFYARAAKERFGDWIVRRGIEAVIPIPLHAKKKRIRGYNQAEVFARCLGEQLGIPAETRLIQRVRNTVPQKELNEKQRKANLKGAFQLKSNIVKYKRVLLVDDIYTTGSTIDAVADCFLEIGIEEIYFLSVCIGEGC